MTKFESALDYIVDNFIHNIEVKKGLPMNKETECILLLQHLVDKSTPKKPTKTSEKVKILGVSTTFTMWYRYCPSCRVMLNPNGYEKPDYCKDCGQALDWGKENDK